MKLIIAGGRDTQLTRADFAKLSAIPGVTEVVSGGCRGADLAGECWAREAGIPVKVFKAHWGMHGRAAGPIRNQQMAYYADALAVFPGGRGTDDMVSKAKACGLQIFDFRT